MALQPEFITWLEDMFSIVPDTTIRKMFGGVGVFRHGLMYALATSDGRISMKADEQTISDFEAEGCEEWRYIRKSGKSSTMGYWYIPERLSDDGDALLEWSLKAFDVALRADQKKTPGQRKLRD
ncbi:MAG: TfoX/Sxy family protein [Rhizobiaceae bacterium]|nr:TfoX/Sxy family protein [Rhizobiaceae bacterium]